MRAVISKDQVLSSPCEDKSGTWPGLRQDILTPVAVENNPFGQREFFPEI